MFCTVQSMMLSNQRCRKWVVKPRFFSSQALNVMYEIIISDLYYLLLVVVVVFFSFNNNGQRFRACENVIGCCVELDRSRGNGVCVYKTGLVFVTRPLWSSYGRHLVWQLHRPSTQFSESRKDNNRFDA